MSSSVYVMTWIDMRVTFVGPFETEADASDYGASWQAISGDNPCWQVLSDDNSRALLSLSFMSADGARSLLRAEAV